MIAPKQDIKIASYQDIAFDGAWKGRGRALWSVAMVGLAFGAAIGAMAPLFPMMGGAALPTLALVGKSIAIYSALGMSAGFTAGLSVGIAAGAVASVAKEQERREKAQGQRIEQTLNLPPGTIVHAGDAPTPEPEPAKPFGKKIKDGVATYFNPKVGAVFTTVGVVAGLIMAAAFFAAGAPLDKAVMPELKLLLGKAAQSTPAVVSYFAGVMGSFGALFAFNFPKMTTDLTHFIGDVMSGEKLGTQWGPAPAKQQEAALPEPEKEKPLELMPTQVRSKSFALEHKRFIMQNILEQSSDTAPEIRTR